jgi:hypothetical protein
MVLPIRITHAHVKTGSKILLRAVIVADEDGRELLTIPSKEILAGPLR